MFCSCVYHVLSCSACSACHIRFVYYLHARLRHIRNLDRKIHAMSYPQLHFPELYLIGGGYKQFFREQPEVCSPRGYTEMKDKR